MQLYIILLVCFVALSPALQAKSDLDKKGVRGKVAILKETSVTIPEVKHYACILRARTEKKYQTVRTTHILDENGNQALCDHYNFENGLIVHCYWKYNAARYKTESITRGSDNSLLSRIVYKYDQDDLPVGISYYNANDSLTYYFDETGQGLRNVNTEYNFDGQGKLREENLYNADGNFIRRLPNNLYASDADDIFADKGIEQLQDKINPDGSIRARVKRVFTYDKDGSIASEMIYRYEQFDPEGNWHKAISWKVNDNDDRTEPIVFITSREISYYH